MSNQTLKKLIWLALFSIAMGYMESAIVVYLRKIYYPMGFRFPLTPIETSIALAEFFREAATIIMLAGIGILSGKSASQKFAHFIFCFAIWDIFYYVFLKLLINWPDSLLTWDILFIIPMPWVGPVLAPCIVSLTMIALALAIIYCSERNFDTTLRISEWLRLSLGSFIIIVSFVWDYLKYTGQMQNRNHLQLVSKDPLFNDIVQYVPSDYNWWIFLLGELIVVYGIFTFIKRMKNGKLIS